MGGSKNSRPTTGTKHPGLVVPIHKSTGGADEVVLWGATGKKNDLGEKNRNGVESLRGKSEKKEPGQYQHSTRFWRKRKL